MKGALCAAIVSAIWVMHPLKSAEGETEIMEEPVTHSRLELIAHISPPIDLRHRNGGSLHISASQIRTGISVEVIRPGVQKCDILRIDKSIVDEEGRSHSFSTYISAYDLWDSVSDGIACTEDVYMKSWRFPEGSRLIHLATNLNIWSDGRNPRVLGVYAEPEGSPHLFAVHEKYFSATADLLVQRNQPLKTGHQPSDNVVARITVCQSFSDATGEFEMDHKTPIMVSIPSSLLLFSNSQRKSVVDDEIGPTWNRSPVPEPIEVMLAEPDSGTPRKGVKWIKKGELPPTKATNGD